MSNAIVVASSTLVAGVLTVVMKVDAGSPPIENFDFTFNFDPAKVTSISAVGPGAGFSDASNAGTPGEFLISSFLTGTTPLAAGATALTLTVTLANPADTTFSTTFSALFNADGTIPATPVQLGDGSFNSPVQGTVSLVGTVTEDNVLTANVALTDGDGLGTLTYHWLRDGVEASTSITNLYALGDADVGKKISVNVTYADGAGNAESATSAQTTAVANVNDAPTGTVTITGTATEDQILTASNALADIDGLGTVSYQWFAGGTAIAGANTASLTLTQAEVGKAITVRASYTDGFGTAESITSAATTAVLNVNDAPVGTVTISGIAAEDQVLTASNNLTDEDGVGTVSYQWLANGTAITGANTSTFTLTQAEVGKAITVRASYTDGQGTAETRTSGATATVTNVNDAPTGTVAIAGVATEGQTLTASNTLADVDGLGTIGYQWFAGGTAITGANTASLTLTQAEVGKAITVKASYTDGFGTAESITSAATSAVLNVNDAPVGTVTISGTAAEDQVLTASNNLTDEDGLGTVSYQWFAAGAAITGANTSTFTLTQAEVGKAITVRASYTDGQGTAEARTSAATPVVTNVNDAPTGGVTINGRAAVGVTLTAVSTLDDADGMGTLGYVWLANGTAISGATTSTYQLTAAEVGKVITVRANYTDGQGSPETSTSTPTATVAANQPPSGAVTIDNVVPKQGDTLTVTNNLNDPDGNGTVTYQWFAGTTPIGTGTSVALTQAHVGKTISVAASYTDGLGVTETVQALTSPVANVNDAPTGAVAIAGVATEGQILTASNTLADIDGLGTIGYQWFAGGTAISGATSSTYTLTQAEVGKAITVKASYTDGLATAESVSSAATSVVLNVNDAPVGTVTISGTAAEDQVLTASNNLADEDGLGTVSYQWLANGTAIANATGNTFTLTQAEVGKAITVRASYTDLQGTAEARTSAATTVVTNVNDAPTGTLTIGGFTGANPSKGQTLTFANTVQDADGLGTFAFQWFKDGAAITGATNSNYVLTAADVNGLITVKGSYTDGQGTAETVTSTATGPVQPNSPPQGAVSIAGTFTQGQTLTASQTLTDTDGIPTAPGSITFQWLVDGVAVTGATNSTFTLGQAQVNKLVSVQARYTDNLGTPESLASAATRVQNVDDPLTGNVTIAGTATQGQTLTAQNTFADVDGLGTFAYQWFANGTAITGATSSTLQLGQAQVNKAITVRATHTDLLGGIESRTSAATANVANVNDLPSGAATITGTPAQGQTLTVNTSALADLDGLGAFGFVWMAGGVAITGATSSTLALTQSQVGKAISVQVSYTDAFGAAERVVSAATSPVANVNDAPTGAVTVEGAHIVGLPLAANTDTVRDIDGLGTFSFQWMQGTTAITGATAATYTPTAADAGKNISVQVNWTDLLGTAEQLASAAVALVSEDAVTPLIAPGVTRLVGDGNGDGLIDSAQVAVASAPMSVTGSGSSTAFVTLVADATSTGTVNTGSTAVIRTLDQDAAPLTAPGKLLAPLGLIDFTAATTQGQTETFSLFVDRGSLNINGYWNQDDRGTWVNLASKPFGGSTTIVGNKVRFDFKITDGGEFDSDGRADGIISNPAIIGAMPLSVVGYTPDVTLTPTTHFFF